PLEGLTIAANVGETNLGLGKRAWDEINNAVAHIRSALTTPGDGETRWMGERINWAGPLFYPPAGMIAVMRSGTRIEIWDDESDHLDCFTGMNLADGDASTLWGREFIDRVEPPAEDDVPRLSGHYRATSNTRHALEVDVFGILSRLARHTHDKGAE
ncbi:hypothetical protein, partial [Pseudogemmobacter sonorensis]|uniref:hypothetical protein n=1 Tax=Pseudogemmobacter sonorensis TaxID=2989681 RepID=UPI00369DD84C